MIIDREMIDAIKIIYRKFSKQDTRWILVGSLSLALQGVNVRPNDIDILINEDDLVKVSKLLKDYETKPIKFSRSGSFKSYLGEYKINNVKIEVMARLRENIGGVWREITYRLYNPKHIKLENLDIPVSTLEDQLESHIELGREKDYYKIIKIRKTLEDNT